MSYSTLTNSAIYRQPYKGIISIILIWSFLFSIIPLDFAYAESAAISVSLAQNKQQASASTTQGLIEAQNGKEAMIEQKNEILNASSTNQEISTEETEKAEEEPLPGDFDGNGKINADDYNFWKQADGSCLGDPGYTEQIDLTGDGVIDMQDYLIIAKSFYAQEGRSDQGVGDINNDGNLDEQDLDLWKMSLKDSLQGDGRYQAIGDMNFDYVIDDSDKAILLEVLGIDDTIPGDFDGSGSIDVGDYNLWSGVNGSKLGDSNFNSTLDLNNDGSIDINDYLVMAQSYYEQEGYSGQSVGDLNNDGQFNLDDIRMWKERQDSQNGDSLYVPTTDLNFGGTIDSQDKEMLINVLKQNGYVYGDLDGDSFINEIDYGLWQQANSAYAGDSNYNIDFDLSMDGVIDINDYLIMAQSYYEQEGYGGQSVGDLNNDGQFNLLDIAYYSERQGAYYGDSQYMATVNLNFDGVIDEQDKVILLCVLQQEGYISGDLNNDNDIDIQDYNLWEAANGSHTGDVNYNGSVDLNNDGMVDITDYLYIAIDRYALLGYQQAPGDINTDGQFDIDDILTWQKEFLEENLSAQGCDLNFDGIIDQTDKALLIGLIVYKGYSIGSLSGDLTGDGIIDVSDYDVWLTHKGTQIGDELYDARYDLNNDGVIDTADLYILVSSFYAELGYQDISLTDFNKDNLIGYDDIVNFVSSFGKIYGDAEYNTLCDLNLDGRISEGDLYVWAEIILYLYPESAEPNEISITCGGYNIFLDLNRFVGYVYNSDHEVIGQYVIITLPQMYGDNVVVQYISVHFNDFYENGVNDNDAGLFALVKNGIELQYAGNVKESDFEKILYREFNGEPYAGANSITVLINLSTDYIELYPLQNLFENDFFENASATLLESIGKCVLDKTEGYAGSEYSVLSIFNSIFHIAYHEISLVLRERILRFTINSTFFAVTLYSSSSFGTFHVLGFLIDYGLNRYGINQNNGFQMWVESISTDLMNQIIAAISDGFCSVLGNVYLRQNYLENICVNIKLALEYFDLSTSYFYDRLANFLVTNVSDIELRCNKQLLVQLSLEVLESGLLTRDRENAIISYLVPKLTALTFNDIVVFIRKAMNFKFSSYTANILLPEIINLAISMPLTVSSYDIRQLLSYAVALINSSTNLNIFDALIAKVNPKLASETDADYANRLNAVIAVFTNYKIILHDLNGLITIWPGLIDIISEIYSLLPHPFQGIAHVISLMLVSSSVNIPQACANNNIITFYFWNDCNDWDVTAQNAFRADIIHETGHLLQFENPEELDDVFLRLYDESISSSIQLWGSYDTDNFISGYAATDYMEDFAENIATWSAGDSLEALYNAVALAQTGKTLRLEKYLFAMKYFRSQLNGKDVLYLYNNTSDGLYRTTLPARFDASTGQIIFLNTGDKIINFIYDSDGRLIEVRMRDLTTTERVLFAGDSDQSGSLTFSEWFDVFERLYSCLGATSENSDPTIPSYVKELDFSADGLIDLADLVILNALEPSSTYSNNVSLFGAASNNSNIKIYSGGYIKITLPDGKVIGGKIGDYLTFQTNVYWKVTTRSDGSLDTFEIYQQQGDEKVLLAKRFYDTQNRLIADMTTTGGEIRVGLKDYTNNSKTIFTIPYDSTYSLEDITLENIGNYACLGKVVYLYDPAQDFADIPLFCMTDSQMLADQPIITIYYKTDDSSAIAAWCCQNMPQGIFIVNGVADITGLIADSASRTSENINNIIQNGDDVFLMLDQVVLVAGRPLYYNYDCYAGILSFFDSDTGEVITSVKYPEESRVVIDDAEYEITIENGVISLMPPVLYEYSVSLFGATGDNADIEIYDNCYVKIVLSDGRIIEGYLGDYMPVNDVSYWKINVRDDGSLETFEIYQLQSGDKVLLAKRFYNKNNQIIADMTAAGGVIQVGIKDYAFLSKTVFTITSDDPTRLLNDMTLDGIWEYAQEGKTVYLYNDAQLFNDVPLFAFTDAQLYSDNPVITLHYQSDDGKKINAWRYIDKPEGIFIIVGDADVEGMLTDVNSRTQEGIGDVIEIGNDIFFILNQTVILPQRSVWCDYSYSTGALTFVDAATCELIGSVKYPGEPTLTIDDKEYAIEITDGVLELEGIFEPFSISVSTGADGNKNLTITVSKDLSAVITWNGQAYECVFDIDSGTITFTEESDLRYEFIFEESGPGYLLESVTVTSVLSCGETKTAYKFYGTDPAKITFDGWAKLINGQYKHVNVAVYNGEDKLKLDGKEYTVAVNKNGAMELTEIATTQIQAYSYNSWLWGRMFFKQRQALFDFTGRYNTEKADDLLFFWYLR